MRQAGKGVHGARIRTLIVDGRNRITYTPGGYM